MSMLYNNIIITFNARRRTTHSLFIYNINVMFLNVISILDKNKTFERIILSNDFFLKIAKIFIDSE